MAAIIANILWFALALAVALESWKLGFGTFVSPGPGFVPFLASLTLAGLSIISFFQALSERKTAVVVFKILDVAKILLVNLVLVVGLLLWEKVGFIFVTFLLLIFMYRVLKPLAWSRVFIAAVVTMAFTWLVFVLFLGLRLPQGTLWKFFLN